MPKRGLEASLCLMTGRAAAITLNVLQRVEVSWWTCSRLSLLPVPTRPQVVRLNASSVVPTHKEFALIPAGLLSLGYSEAEVAKIIGRNFMRLFREVTENRG